MKKAFLLTIALVCALAQGAWSQDYDVWDGVTTTAPTVTYDYQAESGQHFYNVVVINKASELAYVRDHWDEQVDDGHISRKYRQRAIYLTADLDMSAVSWTPLGFNNDDHDAPYPYVGSCFNGNGHTIRIRISGATDNYQGLFAKISNSTYNDLAKPATVKHLHVAGEISCSSSRLVGGIAGENLGTIEDCWVSANVSSNWSNSWSAYTAKVGGIAGETTGLVRNCCVSGNVKNDDADVGGIVGYNNGGTVSHCTFYGSRSSSHSQDNVYVGDQDGTSEDMHTSFTDEELASHISTYSDYSMYCYAIHYPFTVTIDDENEVSLATDVAAAGPGQTVTLIPASDGNAKHIVVRDADGNPVAEWYTPFAATLSFTMPRGEVTVATYDNTTWSGSGTQDDPYLISTAGEWNQICTLVSEAVSDDAEVFSGIYFKQTADITITQGIGVTGEVNNKKFCGIYDGDGHRLNCQLTNPVSGSTEAVAPFHRVKGATIKNLYVTGSINGGIHSAGIAAHTYGTVTIDNCCVSASVTCTGSSSNDAHGGGIVGHAEESDLSIENCLFNGKLIATSNGKGDIRLGAIIGWAGTKTDVRYCMENGSYEGTTADGQTAFCWKDNGNTTITVSSSNTYVSALSYDSGATKSYTVESGTEGLVLDFSSGNWQDTFAGGGKKQSYTYNHIIDGKFFAMQGSGVSFTVTYPENWNVTAILANGEETDLIADSYTFTQGTENTLVTADYSLVKWTDEGHYATAFSQIDNTNKIVTITTPEELALLSKQASDGTDAGSGWTYNLDADLDMSAYVWTAIGGRDNHFLGNFDGQGHTISGINVPDANKLYAGLFGLTNGTVKNLKLANSEIQGRQYVGGIAGAAYNEVENCYVGADVTLTAVQTEGSGNNGKDCGGIVGSLSSQGTNSWGYPESAGKVSGCYSAAKVNGVSRVGGIVGNLVSGTVEYTVSEATVNATSEYAYSVGNISGGTAKLNFYIADTESSNSTDTRAYHVTLSDALKNAGFVISSTTGTNYDCSDLYFRAGTYSSTDYVRQFRAGNEWYGPAFYNIGGSQYTEGLDVVFYFNITKTFEYENETYKVATVGNVKVCTEGGTPETPGTTSEGNYSIKVAGNTVITADPAITLYDDSNSNDTDYSENNTAILYCNNGMTADVTISGRTLYKDGSWNTLCLPFDVTISGSVLDGADVRTLESSSFDGATGTLTLNFSTSSLTKIEAGKPYIIKWATTGANISNPTFENVTVNCDDPIEVGEEGVDPVVFFGIYEQSTFLHNEEGFKNFLYMGAGNKLYYPDGTAEVFYINCFRAYFRLADDLTAGDLASPVRAFALNFGDGETTSIATTNYADDTDKAGAWYDIQGRRLTGKPTTSGIYINNGKKIVIK